jgi:hypothetical protein
MIPQLITYRHRRRNGRWLRLHIPVLPVALVLSPLLVLALLGGLVACLMFRISPVGALRFFGQVLWALPGTRLEINEGQTAVLVNFR